MTWPSKEGSGGERGGGEVYGLRQGGNERYEVHALGREVRKFGCEVPKSDPKCENPKIILPILRFPYLLFDIGDVLRALPELWSKQSRSNRIFSNRWWIGGRVGMVWVCDMRRLWAGSQHLCFGNNCRDDVLRRRGGARLVCGGGGVLERGQIELAERCFQPLVRVGERKLRGRVR